METATVQTDSPLCKTVTCKRPLTRLGPPWNCWICLRCNKHPEEVNKQRKQDDKPETRYVDVKPDEKKVREMIEAAISEDRIREIVRDELADWHIQTPAITRAEIEEMITNNMPVPVKVKPETWRQKAQRLGVELHNRAEDGRPMGMRKKEDVMADIEAVENEMSPSGDANAHPQG